MPAAQGRLTFHYPEEITVGLRIKIIKIMVTGGEGGTRLPFPFEIRNSLILKSGKILNAKSGYSAYVLEISLKRSNFFLIRQFHFGKHFCF